MGSTILLVLCNMEVNVQAIAQVLMQTKRLGFYCSSCLNKGLLGHYWVTYYMVIVTYDLDNCSHRET